MESQKGLSNPFEVSTPDSPVNYTSYTIFCTTFVAEGPTCCSIEPMVRVSSDVVRPPTAVKKHGNTDRGHQWMGAETGFTLHPVNEPSFTCCA